MSPQFRILHQDPWFVAIEKPAGFQVHPSSDPRQRLSRNSNCLFLLSRQLDRYLYPVHRLDRATSGVLLFALDPVAARELQGQFAEGKIRKTYVAVTRGWTDESGVIDYPLQAEDEPHPKPARTRYATVGRAELPVSAGRYPTARWSLVRAEPETGRYHQLRRHFAHISHPLLGDSVHGDGVHNRLCREKFEERALLLKAYSLEFLHPMSGSTVRVRSRWGSLWHRVFDFFGLCPWSG